MNLSTRTIQIMIDAGYLQKEKDGTYQLNNAVQGALRYRKDHGAKKGLSSKEAATTRVHEMRAAQIEQEMKIQAQELVSLPEYLAVFDMILGSLRAELDGFPARITRDREVREKIENGIREMLARAYQKLEKVAQKVEQEIAEEEEA